MALPHTLLTDGAHDEHIAFWTSALGAVSGDFHIRQPWLSPAVDPAHTIEEDCALSPATAALIDDLGRGQDLGALVVVIGAVSFLLHTSTQTPVVAIDSPPLKGEGGSTDLEFIPLITTVDGTTSVRDYLTQVSARVGGSYSFQAFPIAQFSELRLKRPRPTTNVRVSFPGLLDAVSGSGNHDLEISISRSPALAVRLTGRTPAFSREYLATFARHLGLVLEGFRDRSTVLDAIDVMGDEERARVLGAYNTTSGTAGTDHTIHELFQEQAARAGEQIAIQFHDTALTYDTLNRQSNQLARFLQQEYGIQPGDVIGVLTHRAPSTVTGLLGVLKAGGVYLPIDPDYPEERLQFMVADAGVKVLLVHSEHFDRLTALYETPMFALDLQLDTLETADTDLAPACTADDLAYIIYTSGSTGQPKAVLLEHRGFVTMARHHIGAFDVQSSDRLLQFYGLSFDSSLFEVFVSLLSGATLVMVDRATIDDPAQLAAYIETQQVTSLTMPPVYAGTLDADRLGSVRRYVSAGDHCRVEDALRLARTAAYYNSYGPTETSVCVTHYQVDPSRRYGSRIPIGKPITGTTIYLLDERRRAVPEGVVGEICIGGAGLARGYLNRDDLTAEKFVANPFADGERLYCTGDLGVWLPDGNLELIGRKDNQVKIRGYRVELGEIESVLDQHPSVRESAVIAREDEAGHRRLVAYVTGTGAIDITDLKSLLTARLPAFMMPSTFVVLDQMPLTANGKIDRKALAAIVESAPATDPSAGLPQTPVQETLAGIWQDVLGVARVGIHDNLFDLGGDSILIIQIVSRAREAGLKLAPNQLFDHQTVATLAEVAVSAQPSASAVAEQGAIEGPTPLAPMQAWFFEQRFADAHQFNQSVCLVDAVPAGGTAVTPSFDVHAAGVAALAVLTHHDALRLRFAERDGRWTAEYAPITSVSPFEVVDLRDVPADRLDDSLRDAIATCQRGFDLSTGPLFQVRLLQLGGGQPWRLLFIAHHLVVDGVSWRLIVGDFATAYTQASRGDVVRLPAKTTSFRTWVTQLAAVAPDIDRSYWLAPGGDDASPLPTDHPRAAGINTVASAREIIRSLDAETTTALLQDVPRTYTTEINDVLLAGLAMTFQSWTGSDRLLVDLEGHGREELIDDADTSRTVGWFTSQFPVDLRIAAGAGPGDAIKAVKEQLRAVPHRGAGYGVLRYLSGDALVVDALKHRAAPEVLFNYFGQAGKVLTPDLPWTLMDGPTGGDISPRAARPHLLEVNAMVTGGCLTVSWTFSEAIHRRETIDGLASGYERTLRQLVDHCRAATTRQYTPSDFPAAGLDQKSLDALLSKLNR